MNPGTVPPEVKEVINKINTSNLKETIEKINTIYSEYKKTNQKENFKLIVIDKNTLEDENFLKTLLSKNNLDVIELTVKSDYKNSNIIFQSILRDLVNNNTLNKVIVNFVDFNTEDLKNAILVLDNVFYRIDTNTKTNLNINFFNCKFSKDDEEKIKSLQKKFKNKEKVNIYTLDNKELSKLDEERQYIYEEVLSHYFTLELTEQIYKFFDICKEKDSKKEDFNILGSNNKTEDRTNKIKEILRSMSNNKIRINPILEKKLLLPKDIENKTIEELNILKNNRITLNELKNFLIYEFDKRLIGQDEVKRLLVEELINCILEPEAPRKSLLLLGDPGVGKGHIVKALQGLIQTILIDFDLETKDLYTGKLISFMLTDNTISSHNAVYQNSDISSFFRTLGNKRSSNIYSVLNFDLDTLRKNHKSGELGKLINSHSLIFLDELDKFLRNEGTRGQDYNQSLQQLLNLTGEGKVDETNLNLFYIKVSAYFPLIFAANETPKGALGTRFKIIHIPGYTLEEKRKILMKILEEKLKLELKETNDTNYVYKYKNQKLHINKNIIELILNKTEQTQGLRSLNETIESIAKKLTIDLEENNSDNIFIEEEFVNSVLTKTIPNFSLSPGKYPVALFTSDQITYLFNVISNQESSDTNDISMVIQSQNGPQLLNTLKCNIKKTHEFYFSKLPGKVNIDIASYYTMLEPLRPDYSSIINDENYNLNELKTAILMANFSSSYKKTPNGLYLGLISQEGCTSITDIQLRNKFSLLSYFKPKIIYLPKGMYTENNINFLKSNGVEKIIPVENVNDLLEKSFDVK